MNPIVDLYGPLSVVGRSLVVHAEDGTRVACGTIELGDGTCTLPEEDDEDDDCVCPEVY